MRLQLAEHLPVAASHTLLVHSLPGLQYLPVAPGSECTAGKCLFARVRAHSRRFLKETQQVLVHEIGILLLEKVGGSFQV